MRTNIKKRSFIILIAVVVLAFVGAVVSFLAIGGTAQADTSVFTMRGASIRYNLSDKDDGIRFHLRMDKAQYDALGTKQTGLLIIPKSKLGDATLTKDTSGVYNTINNGTLTWHTIVEPDSSKDEASDDMEAVVVIKGFGNSEDYYNAQLAVRGFIKDGSSYTYTSNTTVQSLADVAYDQNVSTYLLTYDVSFYAPTGTLISTQHVRFGQSFDFPTMSGDGTTLMGWYRRTGTSNNAAVWSSSSTAQADINRTVTKNMQFKAHLVGDSYSDVTYTTTIYNKENIFGGDPSVTYRDGYYYYVYFDSSNYLYVLKSHSLEELLEGGSSGWGKGTATRIYAPTGMSNSSPALNKKLWAPELEYINGTWYIYISGCSSSSDGASADERMFVLSCNSQDPSTANSWSTPTQLTPSGFSNVYAIDGHAFTYKNQLYYAFSGQNGDTKPQIYICTMTNPTTPSGSTYRINLDTTSSWLSTSETTKYLKEGPCTIVDGNDLYLMFSMGNYDNTDYHICYYKLTGSNPLTKSHWTNKGTCLEANSSANIYCTGHNHIFKNSDGSWWTSYHGVVGTSGAGSSAYTAARRVMVQPITVSNGTLSFGGAKATVSITDKGGLQSNANDANGYMIDAGNGAESEKSSGRLWSNNGGKFSVETTITRVSGTDQYCAGVTLYQRTGNGYINKLLIGVEKEGNLFLCNDYSRRAYCYKYAGYLHSNESSYRLKVTYTPGNSDANSKFDIVITDSDGVYQKHTYSVAQLNALVSDAVDDTTKAFNLHFTYNGNFRIGLGGNLNTCKFTNVQFDSSKNVETLWDSGWGTSWTPWD